MSSGPSQERCPPSWCPRGGAGLLLLIVLSACHRGATPYRTSMIEAEKARRAGSPSEERQHFDEAARRAKKPKDESEARYRSAQTWLREGKPETGALRLEEFARQHPNSTRASRAWLDAGRAFEKAKNTTRALEAYEVVVSKYPDSGNALGAAERLVELEAERDEVQAHEIWLRLLRENRSPKFDEALRYRHAQALEAVSQKQALLAYEDVARKHPLPRASYSDEALLRAAKLRRELKDPEGALDTLEVLLGQGGPAAIVGSYTRSSYIEALLTKGLILRDDLEKPEAALGVFESLPRKHPHSRLVDDALWECIRTERELGRDPCPRFEKLHRLRPESRYLRCEQLLCTGSENDGRQAHVCSTWLGDSP